MRALVPVLMMALLACGSDDSSTGGGDGGSGGGGTTATGGSGGDGGNPGGGGAGGGLGGMGGMLGMPIEAPNETWTWVDFPESRCANDTPTGIGVNLSSASPNAFIYLMGGGACWDEATCYVQQTSVNIDSGFDQAAFDGASPGLNGTVFDRNDPANPFRDYSFVFVPYCTGDLHAGTRTAAYGPAGTQHRGYDNMTAYLARLVPTFADADRIVISGSSAGGFGASLNFPRTQDAFGTIRVDLLNDSGPFVSEPILDANLIGTWSAAWGLSDIFPPDCTNCGTKFYGMLEYGIQQNPNSRVGLMSFTQDDVIGAYMQLSATEVAQAHDALLSEVFAPAANARAFFIESTAHVFLGNPTAHVQGGVNALEWIAAMVNDDPTWTDQLP